jgi:predicted transposase/invertase (TIGR01784 family)
LKDTYIDKELSEHFSDILYKIKISGKNSYIYLLFEHKSYQDEWIGFQLLRNMIKIWEGYKKQNKRAKKLPIIVPLVIYHGAEKWNVENSITPLFEEIPGTKPYIPDFKAEVFDISHIPDDRIKGEILLRVHLLIQKYIFKPELFEKLEEIFKLLITLSSKTKATEYLEVMIRYLTASIESKKSENLKTEIGKVIKFGGDIMPTIAEKWVKEGALKKEIEICEKLIERNMDNAEIRNITGLSIKKIEDIRKSLKNK